MAYSETKFDDIFEGDSDVDVTTNADGSRNDFDHQRDRDNDGVRESDHGGVDLNYSGLGQSGDNLTHPDISSPTDGAVEFAGGNYGTVSIRDEEGYLHQLMHLDSTDVNVGEEVKAGDKIGTMGGRGPSGRNQYAQHVHYQIRDENSTKVDPEDYWNEREPGNDNSNNSDTDNDGESDGDSDDESDDDSDDDDSDGDTDDESDGDSDDESDDDSDDDDSDGDSDDESDEDSDDESDEDSDDESDGDDGSAGGGGGAGGDSADDGNEGASRFIPRDPLVLDLDGDGVELLDFNESHAYFDLDGNGFSTRTSWLASDDGFLVLDRNKDGYINDISELFGSPTTSGFEELSQIDSNNDGYIDSADDLFSSLQVWQDLSGEGISDPEELTAMETHDIASISLEHESVPPQQGADGQVVRQGVFTRSDGSDGSIAETAGITADVEFSNDPTYSKFVGDFEIDPAVRQLGDIKGYGLMPNLHIAMSLNPVLKNEILNTLSVTDSIEGYNDAFRKILVKWANAEGITLGEIDPNTRLQADPETGVVVFRNARVSLSLEQLGVIKAYSGLDILRIGDGQWRADSGGIATTGGFYQQAWNQIYRNLFTKFLVSNGFLKGFLPGLKYNPETDLFSTDLNIEAQGPAVFSDFLKMIENAPDSAQTTTAVSLATLVMLEIDPDIRSDLRTELNEFLQGHNINDQSSLWRNESFKALELMLIGTHGDDRLRGTVDEDYILGLSGNDFLYGMDGADKLYGHEGRDALQGNRGNDDLFGGAGNDNLQGNEDDDVLSGGDDDDALFGGYGEDILQGGKGDDSLQGGNGNDLYIFRPLDGQDTINNYDRSEGRRDVIKLIDGITPADVRIRRQRYDLYIEALHTDDRVIVQDAFREDGNAGYAIDTIEFSDGTVWEFAQIKQMVQDGSDGEDYLHAYHGQDAILAGLDGDDKIYGSDGNDDLSGGNGDDYLHGADGSDLLSGDAGNDALYGEKGADVLTGGDGRDDLYGGDGNDELGGGADTDNLNGGNGDDLLQGGKGNDSLEGGNGNDIYIFRPLDGQDTVDNYDLSEGRRDVIKLIGGITPADVRIRRQRYDLYIEALHTDDRVIVQDAFREDGNAGYAIDAITFSDGTVWEFEQIKQMVQDGSDGEDYLHAYHGQDAILAGLDGDDKIHGSDGNDDLSGGDGNDYLYGGDGSDLLSGDTGNDALYGEDGADVLTGGDGRDHLYGGNGDDELRGGAGKDSLNGSNGDDLLQGGEGNDSLEGGNGNDIYIFRPFDGQDTINNYDRSEGRRDVLKLINGITPADLRIRREHDDLYIEALLTDDRVIVQNAFREDGNAGYAIDAIEFSDGTEWEFEQIKQMVQDGADGDAYDGQDAILAGLDGDDNILEFADLDKKNIPLAENGIYPVIPIMDGAYMFNTIKSANAIVHNDQLDALVSAMAAFNPPAGIGAITPQEVEEELAPLLALDPNFVAGV